MTDMPGNGYSSTHSTCGNVNVKCVHDLDESHYLSVPIVIFASLLFPGPLIFDAGAGTSFWFGSVYFCVHIHKCMRLLPRAAQCFQQGRRLVNKYYRSTCFDEGATDWGVNSVPQPLCYHRGGWDIIPLFFMEFVNYLETAWHLQKKQKKTPHIM